LFGRFNKVEARCETSGPFNASTACQLPALSETHGILHHILINQASNLSHQAQHSADSQRLDPIWQRAVVWDTTAALPPRQSS